MDYLSQKVIVVDAQAAEHYLSFLKAGSSQYTMDLFNTAGVDMSSPEPVGKAFAVLTEMVDQLEETIA